MLGPRKTLSGNLPKKGSVEHRVSRKVSQVRAGFQFYHLLAVRLEANYSPSLFLSCYVS